METKGGGIVVSDPPLKYSEKHWARSSEYFQQSNQLFIARLRSHGHLYIVHLNPADRRGYRSIVRLVDESQSLEASFNRLPTSTERAGLHAAVASTAEAYQRLGLVPQTLVLGNNSQEFDALGGNLVLGTEDEPFFLHAHVLGRGDPGASFISGAPSLGGQVPGKILELARGKVAWPTEAGDAARAVSGALAAKLGPRRVVYVRHGETSYNKKGVLQGQIDTPLNETGMQQARDIRYQLLPETPIAVSPLQRALMTATIAFNTTPKSTHGCVARGPSCQRRMVLLPGLMERFMGSLQGSPISSLQDPKKKEKTATAAALLLSE